jgi:endonuclease/exonuclease/phosphatase family metal-dependent hydrolase
MPARVRVGTYNLYLGADLGLLLGDRSPEELARNRSEVERQLVTTAFPTRVATLARVLAAQRLDLVGLQEDCTWHADGELLWDFVPELLRALEEIGEPHELLVRQPTFGGSGTAVFGDREVTLALQGNNAILRRVASPARVDEVRTGTFAGAFELPGPGSVSIRIARGWCGVRGALGEDRFWVLNTHTEAYDQPSRDAQRDELLAALPRDDLPLLLVGDFNAPPDQVGMPDHLVDAWRAAGNDEGPEACTCCDVADLTDQARTMLFRIDYVWVRGADVLASWRFGARPEDLSERGQWPSDHAGVGAEVGLPGS